MNKNLFSTIALTAFASMAFLTTQSCLHANESRAGDPALDTTSVNGWIVIGTDGKTHNDLMASTRDAGRGKNVLAWRIVRGGPLTVLAHPSSTTDFQTLEFDIWSSRDSVAAVQLEDIDHAKFHSPVPLSANSWKHVKLEPHDFKINDDSPVKKSRLEPEKLGNAFSFVELGLLLKAKEDNLLRFDNVRLSRAIVKGMESLPPVINRKLIVTKNVLIDHPVVIEPGGSLTITAPQAKIFSNIVVKGGSLAFNGTCINAEGRLAHDLSVKIIDGGKLSLKNAQWYAPFMSALDVAKGCRADFVKVRFNGSGLTTTLEPGATVQLSEVENPGEFVIPPGSRVTANASQGLLFWLMFNSENPTTIQFPSDKSIVKNWQAPEGSKIGLTVNNCRNTMWAIVSASGSTLKVERTKLRAVGLLISKPGPFVVSGVRNKSASPLPAGLSDRKLDLSNSFVETWNFYPCLEAQVSIENCIFGELMTFNKSKVKVERSICDATGGYIRSRQESSILLHNSTFACPVISDEKSRITVDNCKVNGAVTACGRSSIKVIGGRLASPPRSLDQARIEH